MRIAVLAGGFSGEREVSLRSGNNVLQALKRLGHHAESFDPAENIIEKLILWSPELVFIALHGHGGEDGVIQGTLEYLNMKYTGPGIFASALCMNKVHTKTMLFASSVKTPDYVNIGNKVTEKSLEKCYRLKFPVVAKPVSEGSSLGVVIVKKKDHLEKVLLDGITRYGNYFVEEGIMENQEITVSVIGSAENHQVLPVLQLIPHNEFYDYEAKYKKGMTDFILPAEIHPQAYETAVFYAGKIYSDFGLRGFSRIDMLVKNKDVFVTEVNTVPGLTDTSDLPASAKAAGMDFDQLIEKIVRDSLCLQN